MASLVKAIRTFFYAVLLSAFLGIAIPFIDAAFYASRLMSMSAPASISMPVSSVKPGALRDNWHAPRPGGRRHEGIDIFSRKGTPVRATTEGIVTRIGHNRLGGKVVWILGPAGQRHYYAHLDRFAQLSVSQRIEPGIILGYVGNTGNAKDTPPHLHYGIYTRQGAINPYPLLVPSKD